MKKTRWKDPIYLSKCKHNRQPLYRFKISQIPLNFDCVLCSMTVTKLCGCEYNNNNNIAQCVI